MQDNPHLDKFIAFATRWLQFLESCSTSRQCIARIHHKLQYVKVLCHEYRDRHHDTVDRWLNIVYSPEGASFNGTRRSCLLRLGHLMKFMDNCEDWKEFYFIRVFLTRTAFSLPERPHISTINGITIEKPGPEEVFYLNLGIQTRGITADDRVECFYLWHATCAMFRQLTPLEKVTDDHAKSLLWSLFACCELPPSSESVDFDIYPQVPALQYLTHLAGIPREEHHLVAKMLYLCGKVVPALLQLWNGNVKGWVQYLDAMVHATSAETWTRQRAWWETAYPILHRVDLIDRTAQGEIKVATTVRLYADRELRESLTREYQEAHAAAAQRPIETPREIVQCIFNSGPTYAPREARLGAWLLVMRLNGLYVPGSTGVLELADLLGVYIQVLKGNTEPLVTRHPFEHPALMDEMIDETNESLLSLLCEGVEGV